MKGKECGKRAGCRIDGFQGRCARREKGQKTNVEQRMEGYDTLIGIKMKS